METRTFDAITRRASLLALGTAGLAALASLVPAVDTDARKRNKNKKRNKVDANKQCKKQVGQCTATLAPIFEGEENAEEVLACCSFLGSCNVNGYLACVVEATQQT